MIDLDSPVESVLGAAKGARAQKRIDGITGRLGLRTVDDLLHHFPRRYLETGSLSAPKALKEGQLIAVVGEVSHSTKRSYKDRRTNRPAFRQEVVLRTEGPSLRMTFFAQKAHVATFNDEKRFVVGRRGIFMGKVGTFGGDWQLTNPQMILFGDDGEYGDDTETFSMEDIGPLYPLYPATKDVESWDLQKAISFALTMVDEVPELLPEPVMDEYEVLDASTALKLVHAPETWAQITKARHRYRFEEALVTQLVLGRSRRAVRRMGAKPRTGGDGALLAAFDARLPWELTRGQAEIGAQIESDLANPFPMNRLLQGEVGSGKTLVALRAMLRVVDSGGQAALLAPTEVLAQQHHRSVTGLLGDLAGGGMLGGAEEATSVELLTGSMTKTQRTAPLSRLASGEAGIVIGTHALLEEHVQFADLGLVVVDEQHRFGVEQRAALTDKAGSPPHVLVMTATPIPRTVAMTVFGDLEVSTLTELPAGRAAIQTNVVPLAEQPSWMGRVWQRVREEVDKGHQAYVVCPRITSDETEQVAVDVSFWEYVGAEEGEQPPSWPLQAVEDLVVELAEGPLSGLRVAKLHGRMTPDDKDRTMRAFAAGEIDVLVSTTVIEVGVDVANATTMVLLDADRFGISQLHQLRGRVGRGGLPGLCLLVSRVAADTDARVRLDAVAGTTDGFELSRVDLEQRREGDVLGRSQSGFRSSLQNLKVLRDEDTIVAARQAAESLLDDDETLAPHPLLAESVLMMEASRESDFMEKS